MIVGAPGGWVVGRVSEATDGSGTVDLAFIS